MGLVELLIAMTVMSIGIFALVAGLSSGFGSINRASKASTAATLADQQMELFRSGSWDSVDDVAGATVLGPDGRSYWIESIVDDAACPDETAVPTGTPPTCTLADGVTSRPLKRATVTVKEGSDDSGRLLITETSTFDQSTG